MPVQVFKDFMWKKAYVLLTFTALFWAGNSVVGRGIRDFVPPVSLAFWRWSLALLLLLPLAYPHLRKDWPVIKSNLPITILLGVLGIGAFNTLLYTGLQTTTAINGTLLQAAQPALILLFGALLMKDRPSFRQISGIPISFIGVLVILSAGDLQNLVHLDLNRGDAIIGGGVIVWAIYAVLLRRRPNIHPLSFLASTLIIGVVVIFPFYMVELAQGKYIVASLESAMAIAYVAIFPSFLAYLCFNRGVELIGSAATGQYMNVLPVMGAGLAMVFLGETLHIYHIIGIIFVMAGIFIAGKGRPNRQNPNPVATVSKSPRNKDG